MTEREKMLFGEYYDPSDAELVKLRLEARLLTEKLNQTSVSCPDKRVEIVKSLLGSTGNSIHIESTFNCDYGLNIHVGENFYANFGCVILDVAEVRIGENCFIAPQVGIYTATHPIDPIQRNSGVEFAKPIRIGNNCWIGGHATINPGVTLGDNVVVASGAVVTKSFGSNVVIGGNPARVLKAIE
ncbi:sugar O-acetyltransferase [Halomonas aquamarina]|jgi:maltose O-acetyltransferase|nr:MULTISPECIES: sugar O-acetyltransferase [Halomonas]MCF2913290.1 sugar O-acetyltransferase [Halomonas sp. Cn5-12]MCO7242849.1 sugar O-acetyltransferase [Halomonas sp. Ps84H-12]MDC8444289.1 sugar O-acetyltransferase [Halomonas aquamarina]|tara:strand:- start:175 stop:729 length:555 start_codon:yes stop_codon:yes gene_type:complete